MNTLKRLILLSWLAIAPLALAEAFGAYDHGWQWGTPAWEAAYAAAPAAVAGWTAGSLFGQGEEVDAFLVQLENLEPRGWQSGLAGLERAYAMLPADRGYYLAGTASSPATDAMRSQTDAWLVRLDGTGRLVWQARVGGSLKDEARALAPAPNGGVYLAGSGEGRVFRLGAGGRDAIVARFSASGERLWGAQWGTDDDDFVTAAAPDGAGGVYLAGYSDVDEDCRRVSERGFLLHYSATGELLWSHRWGTDAATRPKALLPAAGGVWVFGETDGALYGPYAGGWDIFAVFASGPGNLQRGTQWGGSSAERVNAVVLDPSSGSFWIAGATASDDLFGKTSGGYDAMVVMLNSNATPGWAWLRGSPADDEAYGLACDGQGDLWVSGVTYGDFYGVNAGQADAWAARLCFDPHFGPRTEPSRCEK
ncbi:hypothetical protein [Oceanithermus sp.]